MTEPLPFASCYQGRHAPLDALWWLEHPASPAPSGARPVQEPFLLAADELRAAGHLAAERALLEVLADLLGADQRAALDALDDSQHAS